MIGEVGGKPAPALGLSLPFAGYFANETAESDIEESVMKHKLLALGLLAFDFTRTGR
jgi:hypothetical protein